MYTLATGEAPALSVAAVLLGESPHMRSNPECRRPCYLQGAVGEAPPVEDWRGRFLSARLNGGSTCAHGYKGFLHRTKAPRWAGPSWSDCFGVSSCWCGLR